MSADPCVSAAGGEHITFVFVDDIIVAAQSIAKLAEVKNKLTERF